MMRQHIFRYLLAVAGLCLALGTSAQKKSKFETPEHLAKREVTRQALDTIIKNQAALSVDLDKLIALVDEKCGEMKDDPWLMSKMALDFSTWGGYIDLAEQRFADLKKKFPNYLEGYIDHANMRLAIAELDGNIDGDVVAVQQAKAAIDSAKMVDAKSMRPYTFWIQKRAPFIKTKGLEDEIKTEIENWNAKFPDSLVYLRAARLLLKANVDDINKPELKDRFDGKWITELATEFYEKAGYENLSSPELVDLSNNSFFHGHLDKGAEIAALGITRGEEARAFHRLGLWNNALASRKARLAPSDYPKESQTYLQTAQDMLSWLNEQSQNLEYFDLVYAGLTYQESKDYPHAIDFYQKALAAPHGTIDSRNAAFFMNDSLNILRSMAVCYMESKDYEKYVELQRENILLAQENSGKFSLSDWSDLADGYTAMGRDSTFTVYERLTALMAADSIYASLQQEIDNGYETSAPDCYFMNMQLRRRVEMNNLESERTVCTSKEIAEKLYNRLGPDRDILGSSELGYLLNATVHLCNIYIRQKDYKKAAVYAEVILEIKPDHENAETYYWLINNHGKKRRK